MCLHSRNFRRYLFTNPKEYEEVPLRDRKRDVGKLKHNEKKAEFIRDVIALANTARLFGQPAYLLYGIDDEGNLYGVKDDVEKYYGPIDGVNTWEKISQWIGQTIKQYITPPLSFRLKHGDIEKKKVFYLIIKPITPSKPFQVKQALKSRERPLSVGQCWIRFGESKHVVGPKEISPSEAPYCYAYSTVPYVLPSVWLRYFEEVLTHDKIARAGQIQAYQKLFAGDLLLESVIEKFLEAKQEWLLIIRGAAGSGKSAFLRRLTAELAEANQIGVEDIRRREEFLPPSAWIPVYFPLRNERVPDSDILSRELLRQVNCHAKLWNQEPDCPDHLFELPELHWLICLDGLDELWEQGKQQNFLSALRAFQRHYPKVKIILTTRPDINIPSDLGKVIDVSPLSQDKILAYIGNYTAGDNYDEIVGFLKSEPELWGLCAIPAYLEAAVEVLADVYPLHLEEPSLLETEKVSTFTENKQVFSGDEDALELPKIKGSELIINEPVNVDVQENDLEQDDESLEGLDIQLGILLDRVFDHLWEREAGRRPLPTDKTARWRNRTGEIAIWMDGHRQSVERQEITAHYLPEEAIHWILSLGILRHNKRGWFCFANSLTKCYFAAAFLRPFVEEGTWEQAQKYVQDCKIEFRQEIQDLLQQITYQDLEPLFMEVKNE